jgi:hypothetical protein
MDACFFQIHLSTATHPGTAPVSYYPFHPSFGNISGSSEVVPPSAANSYGSSELACSSSEYGTTPDATNPSVSSGYDSPFSFHPPALADQPVVSQKQPFSGINNDNCEWLGSLQAVQNLDPNHADSLSWNFAMTQMWIPSLNHFYPFQQHSRAS